MMYARVLCIYIGTYIMYAQDHNSMYILLYECFSIYSID